MKKLYSLIDGAIMDCANASLKAWNWTTGGTRADLASLLSFGPSVGLSSLCFQGDGLFKAYSVGAGAFFAACALIISKAYHNFDSREANAMKSNAKDFGVEYFKETSKVSGPILTFSPYLVATFEGGPTINTGVGISSLGLSMYVMRADYLPPRKDFVRRGLEKLAESFRHNKESSVTV